MFSALAALTVLALLTAAAPVAAAGAPIRFSAPVEIFVGWGAGPGRMASADFNGDGNADLASVQVVDGTVAIALGTGTGAFRRPPMLYRTPASPVDVVAADVDGDGDVDVAPASADRSGSIAIFLNDGSGRLRRVGVYTSAPRAYAVVAADLDRDGVVDLATANYTARHLSVLRGQGAGRFAVVGQYIGAPATDIALGDLNGDGTLDAALGTNAKRRSIAVRLGGLDGSFGPALTFPAGVHPFSVTLADFNHDQRLDVADASYDGGGVDVVLGQGDGTFGSPRRYPTGDWSFPDAALVADFDRDGHPDIAAPHVQADPILLRGNGDGTFVAQSTTGKGGFGTQGGAVADFNGDGWPDLAVAEAEIGTPLSHLRVLLNWTGRRAAPCVVSEVHYDWEFPPGWGTMLGDARAEIRRGGCRLGRVSRKLTGFVEAGNVISQRPAPYTVLPSGGRVDLVVSRGRRH